MHVKIHIFHLATRCLLLNFCLLFQLKNIPHFIYTFPILDIWMVGKSSHVLANAVMYILVLASLGNCLQVCWVIMW